MLTVALGSKGKQVNIPAPRLQQVIHSGNVKQTRRRRQGTSGGSHLSSLTGFGNPWTVPSTRSGTLIFGRAVWFIYAVGCVLTALEKLGAYSSCLTVTVPISAAGLQGV